VVVCQRGKFLLLPPGYKGAVPKGYYVYRSATYNVFIFLRGFYENPTNLWELRKLISGSLFKEVSRDRANCTC
jgi:hypothetical protein